MPGQIIYGFDPGSLEIDNFVNMTNNEFAQLKERLKNATDRELSQVYSAMGAKDPFTDPGNRLLLRSKIREGCITQIEKWFRNGVLTAKKNA